jgi:hypothetical protein
MRTPWMNHCDVRIYGRTTSNLRTTYHMHRTTTSKSANSYVCIVPYHTVTCDLRTYASYVPNLRTLFDDDDDDDDDRLRFASKLHLASLDYAAMYSEREEEAARIASFPAWIYLDGFLDSTVVNKTCSQLFFATGFQIHGIYLSRGVATQTKLRDPNRAPLRLEYNIVVEALRVA